MEEFKLLTAGVVFNRGRASQSVRFSQQQKLAADREGIKSSPLNFFGETKDTAVAVDKSVRRSVSKELKSVSIAERDCDQVSTNSAVSEEWFQSENEIQQFRAKNKIYVHSSTRVVNSISDDEIPPPIRTFDDLEEYYNVDSWCIANIRNGFRFKTPTPIQMQAIPCILTGRPLLASAPTGSGKTLAFLIPLLTLMRAPSKDFLRSLVIVPSRELAIQTVREFEVLRGSKKFRCRILERQTTACSNNAKSRLDCGVSTPLKLVQLLRDGQLSFKHTRHIVMDEADRLLDMGFAPQLDEILSHVNMESVQLILFSATLGGEVLRLAESIIFGATRLSIGSPMAAASEVEQKLLFVTDEMGKLSTFRQLVSEGTVKPPALIFAQTIERAKELFAELVFDGLLVDVIHADRPKRERDQVVKAFREKKVWVLISTDLMARGVDFKGVHSVVNWDLPHTAASYIHRVGRTGRAGKKGMAVTFFTLEDVPYLRAIVHVMRQSGCDVPQWLLNLKKTPKKAIRHFSRVGIKRKSIKTDPLKPRKRQTKPEKKVLTEY